MPNNAAGESPRARRERSAQRWVRSVASTTTARGVDGADLKDQVASPSGTTIAALASLEDAGVRGAYLRAVQRTAVEVRRRLDSACTAMIEQ